MLPNLAYNSHVVTETAALKRTTWQQETARVRRAVLDPRLLLVVVLALLAGLMAYQAPARADVLVGWLGDRLFLTASEGQAAADRQSFYGDEITDHAQSGRSRWTHAAAQVRFPGIGSGDLTLLLRAQGWPTDALHTLEQPEIVVLSDQHEIARFIPTAEWADYRLPIPADQRTSADVVITLQASETFTGTTQFRDPRPKGLRVEYVGLRATDSLSFHTPALLPLLLLALNAALWLLAILSLTNRPNLSFALTTLLVACVAIGMAVLRGWAVVLLPWLTVVGIVVLALAWRSAIAGMFVRLLRAYGRGEALNYGLIAAGVAWLIAMATWGVSVLPGPTMQVARAIFPDSLLYGLLLACVLLLLLVLGRRGLPQIVEALVAGLAAPQVVRIVLGLFLLIWMGYLGSVIAVLPYVGHADYADNAVVARNLLAGRGWVVDYVTQFFTLYQGVTRPQETWPLLQPVWIAPFFALFGPHDWAAKLPNLIFLLLLGLAVYHVGTRLWDRRIGLTATILLLTSELFFKLVIYATSDLAFVLFAFLALWLLYRIGEQALPWRSGLVLAAGVLTGLMIVQKPGSGGIVAIGMGLWLLWRMWPARPTLRGVLLAIRPGVVWGGVALLIVTPLIVRNLVTFGKIYYSTESHDAWILEYTNWDEIYAVYTPALGGEGTPDRSWILRWGFDRTQKKIDRQFQAVRDYLMPGWQGLPAPLADLVGRADKDIRLLFDVGAWLSLLGLLGVLAGRPRLVGLLLAAFTPYTIFLALYWHANEERYFVVVIPWLALFAGLAIWRGYDRMAAIGDRRWAPLGLAMAMAALWLTIVPSWPVIAEKVREEPQLYAADLDAYAWLAEQTPRNAVMMSRNPWQLNWHSERPALMIPYTTDRETFLALAEHYQVQYLVLDSLQRPEPEVRQLIAELLADPELGFREVYRTPIYVAEYRGARKELVAEVYAFPGVSHPLLTRSP
ncbi:MAG: glycosyltransferase family 39 protein [Roseiflexaceae bacterium]